MCATRRSDFAPASQGRRQATSHILIASAAHARLWIRTWLLARKAHRFAWADRNAAFGSRYAGQRGRRSTRFARRAVRIGWRSSRFARRAAQISPRFDQIDPRSAQISRHVDQITRRSGQISRHAGQITWPLDKICPTRRVSRLQRRPADARCVPRISGLCCTWCSRYQDRQPLVARPVFTDPHPAERLPNGGNAHPASTRRAPFAGSRDWCRRGPLPPPNHCMRTRSC